MLFRKVFDCYINSVVWTIVLITFTSLILDSSGVVAQSRVVTFDKDVEEVTSKVMVDDKSDKMIGSATNIDRTYTSRRVKLFDDIFNIPITVLQQVNNLIQGIVGSPGQSIMAASGFGRSLDMKEEKDLKA